MKPSKNAQTAAAIVQSKGKMFEYSVPLAEHIAIPKGLKLEELFPLAIGILGDFASAMVNSRLNLELPPEVTDISDLKFSANVLCTYVDTRLNDELNNELYLLASSAFYLADMPGTAIVYVRRVDLSDIYSDDVDLALKWIMGEPWRTEPPGVTISQLRAVLQLVVRHYASGIGIIDLDQTLSALRDWAYSVGTPHQLLYSDIISAVVIRRFERSAWTLLPTFTGMSIEHWRDYLERARSAKEMWPSQNMLGEAGLYNGASAIIQMPTSAGKTKATELIIRAAFLAKRTTLAIIVAPFRALVQEIASSLRVAFRQDSYKVDQISDALQPDFIFDLDWLIDTDISIKAQCNVIVVTPEKLLYIIRQVPELVSQIGLVVFDEGHQFDTGKRGVTYELLLTSIKRQLPDSAQSVLISAVITNAAALASWLFHDPLKVVTSSAMQTQRLLAFTSWPQEKPSILSFREKAGGKQSFFVPRVLSTEKLARSGRESSDRYFPIRDNSNSIALYLGIRLVPNGGVAIFVGNKVSASKIIRDAAEEVFARGISLDPPSVSCEPNELARLVRLFQENFGEKSYLTKAAKLGIFGHHGNTPHGLRLAIEHAMREEMIRLVVCTSTLAQGINLPIRYLLVTATQQGADEIRARDFHNLMGRAGRAGFHGEGTVIFTNPALLDEKDENPNRWEKTQALLNPEQAGPTGSTLLSLLDPLTNTYRSIHKKRIINTNILGLIKALIISKGEVYANADRLSDEMIGMDFSAESLKRQLDFKCDILGSIESFLMSYREEHGTEDFIEKSAALSRETLAYHLGTEESKSIIEAVFRDLAAHIESLVPDLDDQARYGKTLLGVLHAVRIDEWVSTHSNLIVECWDELMLLEVLWPLLCEITPEPRLHDTQPIESVRNLARSWVSGEPYSKLLDDLIATKTTFPYGTQRRKYNIDLVVKLCENTFGFEFSLILGAISAAIQKLVANEEESNRLSELVLLLQKRLKYGLPDINAICFFEAGFSERVICQNICKIIPENVESVKDAKILARAYGDDIQTMMSSYPSYYRNVFDDLIR